MCKHLIAVLTANVVLALACLLPGHAQAQTDSARPVIHDLSSRDSDKAVIVGKVVTATGAVTIEHASAISIQANVSGPVGQTRVGDLVYQGDVVKTGADGRIGINFTDGTSFNISSNARMALDEYVYDPNGKSNSTLFNLTKGTFTFVAGNIAKSGDMKVETPVATMGIRGTTPHVEISDDGSVRFSTLIEEGKSKVIKKSGAPTAQPPDHKPDLNICRRC
jgi:FecR protein